MRILFYHPAPITENATAASGIRPYKILSAFKKAGYIVDTVCGYPLERKRSIQRIKENVAQGVTYDFAYGENTTYPFPLNDPRHNPKYLFLDYSFWRWMKKENIPFGCFYRDIYWKYSEFTEALPLIKRCIFYAFHYLDVLLLKRYSTSLFLPSDTMASSLPFYFEPDRIHSLPPGCEIEEQGGKLPDIVNSSFTYFYVGGIVPPNYDLSMTLEVFSTIVTNGSFILCCREKEWNLVLSKKIYDNIDFQSFTITHEQGEDLKKYWKSATLFVALWEKIPYHNFAVPFKIFEALGHGVPIITGRGTEAGRIVEANNVGWAIEPTREALTLLLERIIKNPELIIEKKRNMLLTRHKHTWEARIQRIAEVLIKR